MLVNLPKVIRHFGNYIRDISNKEREKGARSIGAAEGIAGDRSGGRNCQVTTI
jgi:hypothetical protein